MIRLSMDRISKYRITIPGEVSEDWLNYESRMEMEVEIIDGKPFTTTMSGRLDQAALMGLLRRLYNLGLPLISVECVDFNVEVVR